MEAVNVCVAGKVPRMPASDVYAFASSCGILHMPGTYNLISYARGTKRLNTVFGVLITT